MYSHISFWCNQIGSAFFLMNSSASMPSIVGGRLICFCLPFMKTVMYSSCRFFFAAFCSGVSFFFRLVICVLTAALTLIMQLKCLILFYIETIKTSKCQHCIAYIV